MLRSQYPYFGPKSEVSTKDTKYPYIWGLTVVQCAGVAVAAVASRVFPDLPSLSSCVTHKRPQQQKIVFFGARDYLHLICLFLVVPFGVILALAPAILEKMPPSHCSTTTYCQ